MRNKVKVIVGGAPITADFAASIGADSYAQDLFGAAEAVADLVNNRVGRYTCIENSVHNCTILKI